MRTLEKLVMAGLVFIVGYLIIANAAAFLISFVFTFIYRVQIGPTTGLPVHQGKDPYIETASVLMGIVLSAAITRKFYRTWWSKVQTEPAPTADNWKGSNGH